MKFPYPVFLSKYTTLEKNAFLIHKSFFQNLHLENIEIFPFFFYKLHFQTINIFLIHSLPFAYIQLLNYSNRNAVLLQIKYVHFISFSSSFVMFSPSNGVVRIWTFTGKKQNKKNARKNNFQHSKNTLLLIFHNKNTSFFLFCFICLNSFVLQKNMCVCFFTVLLLNKTFNY